MSKISNVLTMIEYLSTGRKYSIAELSEKLEDGHFVRSEPQIGEEFNPTPEFIEKTISNYQKLLELGLIPSFEEESVSEEKGPVLQKIRKENK